MKSLGVIALLVICSFQLSFAGPESFSVSGFEYPEIVTNENSDSENAQRTEENYQRITAIPSAGGTTNIFIGGARTDREEAGENNKPQAKREKGDTLRLVSHISYWTTPNGIWHEKLAPVISSGAVLGFPKVKSGLFSFSTEAGLDYRLSLGRGDMRLVLNSIELKIPLVFSFSLGNVSELSLVISAFYEHIFLNIQSPFEDSRSYNHNQAGVSAGVRYVYRISDALALGMRCEYELPVKKDSFDVVAAGVVLVWRAL